MYKTFGDFAWKEYRVLDKRLQKKTDELFKAIEVGVKEQNLLSGIGKPEALVGDLSGFYSRRIDEKNRLVYSFCSLSGAAVEFESIYVLQCGGHYGDK